MNEATDPALAVDDAVPAVVPSSRLLDRAVRAAGTGPRPCYRAALVSLAGTCALAIALCLRVRPAGYLPGPQLEITVAALAGLVVTSALGLGTALNRSLDPGRRL